MTWFEDEATVTRHQTMQFAEECIETKTVTTTTTTKRSYPPLFLREPRDVHSLDSKEYPLAARPTPPELRRLTFSLDDEIEGWVNDEGVDAQVRRHLRVC
jgi:F-box and WD-40 domain protein CDC4